MSSNIFDRLSYLSLFLVVILAPVFFLPFSRIPVETSKGLLLVVGLALSVIFWTMARFSDGEIVIPRSTLLLSGLGVVAAFLLSAIFSSSRQMSFFGTMLDTGTFWFMLAVFALMLFSSMVFKDEKRAGKVLLSVILVSVVLFIFQGLRLFFPEAMSFGVLGGKTDNILGSWNTLGIFAGFFITMSVFVMEFFHISRVVKSVLGVFIFLALLLMATVSSSLAWAFLGVFSLFIFIYKVSHSFAKHHENPGKAGVNFPIASFVIVVLSVLFFMSGQFLGSLLPNRLGAFNLEVGPSFVSTMSVTKGTLLKDPVLGIGPNRFGDAWAMHKPAAINESIFWNTHFEAGSGSIPTFFATTGIIGVLSLLIFFFLFFVTGFRSLFASIKHGTNQIMSASFLAALYLFAAAIFYSVGPAIFIMAFAFTGIFIGISSAKQGGEINILFSHNPKKSVIALMMLMVLMAASFIGGFKYLERFASVHYFAKALAAETLDLAEPQIVKANLLYQNDLYLRTYSGLYLAKLNSLVSKGSSISEDDKAKLQPYLDQAVSGSNMAIAFNKGNYLNLQTLGDVYSTVAAFGVEGGYDKAVEAYKQASALNPLNPGIHLQLARVSMANEKTKDAKAYANAALALKPNYIEALVFLSQVAKSEGNNSEAVSLANRALALDPTNKDLIAFVNSVKNGTPAPDTSTDDEKTSN